MKSSIRHLAVNIFEPVEIGMFERIRISCKYSTSLKNKKNIKENGKFDYLKAPNK